MTLLPNQLDYDSLSILVSSCDKYAVCWQPFCHGLEKYWPEHPQKLFFITNQLDAPCGVSLKTGADQGWAKNLLWALDRVETDYIFYSQEDYWIKGFVPNAAILDYLGYLNSGLADYIRLYPAPGPDLPWCADERLGVISEGSHYRASLQMALWRKETLKALVLADESPWDFEVKGTQRSQKYGERFLCVSKRKYGIDYVFTAIVNGYWSDLAYKYAESEGLNIPFYDLPDKPAYRRFLDKARLTAHKIKQKIKKVISPI